MRVSGSFRDLLHYGPEHRGSWNSLVARSLNGTFLFDRDFMEYHQDRFADRSVLLRESDDIIAVLPANQSGKTICSHGGLTYGGLVVAEGKSSISSVLKSFDVMLDEFRKTANSFVYKAVPHIYHKQPCEADLYALFRLGATLRRRDVSSAIPPGAKTRLRKGRHALVQRASKISGLRIERSEDWQQFHALLADRLASKYEAAPVHSVEELQLLSSRFPENIRLASANLGQDMIAGCMTFETPTAIHTQYLATNALARENGAMDLLVLQQIKRAYELHKWFDFGISTTDGGQVLNTGLADYKEGFGARAVVYDHYEISL